MRKSQCPVCMSGGAHFIKTKDYNRRLSENVFCYHHCPYCKLIYLVNTPESLEKYYPTDYYTIPEDRNSLLAASAHDQYKLEILQQFIQKGRLLEIGPAWGTFAYLAKRSGFDVEVVERNAQCCRFIQNELGIKAVQADNPADAINGLSGFDAVALWQVVEHLLNPWETLKAAADKLLPGGRLILSTPNPASFQFRVLGPFWAHLDAPRHLFLIPGPLLVKIMASFGLKTVLLTTTDKGTLGWNSFGWAVSFQNRFVSSGQRSTAHLLGRLLSKILIPVERSRQRGSAYTAVFEKERS